MCELYLFRCEFIVLANVLHQCPAKNEDPETKCLLPFQRPFRLALLRRGMRRRHILIWCLAASVWLSGDVLSAQVSSAPLTLADCIQKALSVASSVTLARRDREIGDRDRTIARSGFLPQGSVNITYSQRTASGSGAYCADHTVFAPRVPLLHQQADLFGLSDDGTKHHFIDAITV
jgi:hypothetical protein